MGTDQKLCALVFHAEFVRKEAVSHFFELDLFSDSVANLTDLI